MQLSIRCPLFSFIFFFFFNDTAPPEIYPLSLHAALPLSPALEVKPHEPGSPAVCEARLVHEPGRQPVAHAIRQGPWLGGARSDQWTMAHRPRQRARARWPALFGGATGRDPMGTQPAGDRPG